MTVKNFFWAMLLFCNFFIAHPIALPWGPPSLCDFNNEEYLRLLPQDDEGYDEPTCCERCLEEVAKRKQDWTSAKTAGYVLGTFVVAASSMLIWMSVNGTHYQ